MLTLTDEPASERTAHRGPVRVLVIQHHRENRKKCSLTPALGRSDMEVIVPQAGPAGYPPLPLPRGILLQVGAPPLTDADRALLVGEPERRLVLLDGNWSKIPSMLAHVRGAVGLEPRSLPSGIQTAYPRRSKVFEDPEGGLASIEALHAALAILGQRDDSWLDGYHWKREFLDRNASWLSLIPPGALPSGVATIEGRAVSWKPAPL